MRGSQLGRTPDRGPAPVRGRHSTAAAAVLTMLVALVAGAVWPQPAVAGPVRAPVARLSPVPLAPVPLSPAPLSPVPATSPGPASPTAPAAGHDRSEALVYALAVVFAAAEQVAESDGRDLVILVFVLLVVRLFLTIQNWIDRQDPKLVAAPLTRDRYMEFRDPPPAAGRRTPRRQSDDGEDAR